MLDDFKKNSKANILLFTLEYAPFKGGVANVYQNIVRYWNDSDIFVLTGQKLLKPHWIFSFFYLLKEVKNRKINVVMVGHILPLGTVTYFLAKFINIKYVVFLHGMDLATALQIKRKKKMAQKILARADKIICMNSRVEKILHEELSGDFKDKTFMINPGVLVDEQAKTVCKELVQKYNLTNKKILLQVGRLVDRKGIDKVLEVMPDVLSVCPDLVYVIIGSGGQQNNYELLIKNNKLQNNVIFITDADDDELNSWYELCDFFIMIARENNNDFEGFGIVYLEANAHGKPVVAGDSGGVRDVVQNGVNGLLVDPQNTTAIKNAIIKLYQNEDLRQALGEGGKERVKDFFWPKQVKKIQQIILF